MLDSDTIDEYVTEIEKEKEAEAEKKKQKKWCLYTNLHFYYSFINVSHKINIQHIGKKNETNLSTFFFIYILLPSP